MSTATTHIQTEKKQACPERSRRVPAIRFKEFDRDWKSFKLIELSINGFSNGAFNDPKKVGSGYRIINVLDMYIDGPIQIDTLKRIALDDKEYSNNRVEYGDIFFTRSSLVKEGIAFSNVNLTKEEDLTYDGHLIRMRPNKEICLPLYLYNSFKTSGSRKQFIVRGKTATMTTIGQEDISDVNVPLPTLPEQQKIASFLSALDEKIQKLIKKKELLEHYKKGVKQQLFTSTGSGHSTGQLHFKDKNGNPYPDWEDKKISEVCLRSTGRSKSNDIVEAGVNTIVDMGAVSKEGKLIESKRTNCEEDYLETVDLVMAKDDIGGGQIIGKVVLIPVNNKYILGDHVYKLKVMKGDVKFLYYSINSYGVNKSFRRKANGTAQIGINNKTVDEQLIPFPCLEEQQKIATYLSSIDTKIEAVNSQIIQTQTFKKGLLQQMFV